MSLVSIITPSYNSKDYIEKTIQSVINQTYKDWELIITDDCSTDGTFELLQEISERDERISVHRLSENGGPGKARNNSIAKAKGEYIAFIDSDDIWHEIKLEKQLSFMSKNKAGLSFSSYRAFNEEGVFLKNIVAKERVFMKDMLKANYIGCSTAIYDRNKLGRVFMPEIRKRQDYGLWIDIIRKEKVAYGLKEPLVDYLVMKDSVSSNKLKVLKYQWKFYREVVGLTLIGAIRSTVYWFAYSILGIKNKGR